MIDLTNEHVLTGVRIAAEDIDSDMRHDRLFDTHLVDVLNCSHADLVDALVELTARRAGTYVVETPIESAPAVQGRLADIRRQVADTGEYL